MEAHFTYLSPVIEDPNWQKFTLAVLLGAGLVLLGRKLTARLSSEQVIHDSVVPGPRVTLFGFFDLFLELFLKHYDSVLGKDNRRHFPFVASCFLFILSANLVGLIPGMPAITATVWINVGMAIVVFVYFNWVGIKTSGLINYLKHFCGPVWVLAILIFPLEIFSTCLRILTLNLRLYWNITADHLVLGTFTNLLPAPLGAPTYILGTFVSFMQAFVFTTLTMVYILLASQHEESHH